MGINQQALHVYTVHKIKRKKHIWTLPTICRADCRDSCWRAKLM